MIHLFKRAGFFLALDVGSGAVHVLDEPAYRLLESIDEAALRSRDKKVVPANLYDNFGQDTVDNCFDELLLLLNNDLLFSNDDYSEFSSELGPAPVKAMCLHIAHDCNLRCRYCFASTGGFGGTRKLMPFEVAKKAIDMLIAASGDRRNLEVDFFGGEPLMNFEVVRQTVEYAKNIQDKHGKQFRFTLTTNGLGLNAENIVFINEEMGNVVLSLDGRRDVNDKMRPQVNGVGSYDIIVPRYQQLLAKRGNKEYYVRGTYTAHNLDFDNDVLELYGLGFDQISVEPVVGPETDSYAIQESDIPAIEHSYTRLMETMIERKQQGSGTFNFFHFMLDLDNGPCAIKRLKGCGSGNEYLAVTPDGELYPCHQFVGNEHFKMGTVDTGVTQPQLMRQFADAHLLNKPTCQNCWAKYFCSGGCNANNHTFTGSIYEPHHLSCELEKIRLECAIAIQAANLV
ncbi:MAG: thioether cross-link-forming SCIFF peptide maturase [Ruminococcaceae bacterium]|nr:thioether cross-link-forming SCIFF peptide maturase [Oscillospiraceae bacterium]